MLDYIRDYGHISFDVAALNDVDRLVFSQTAYLNFTGAVSMRGACLHDVLAEVSFEETELPTEQRFAFQQRNDRELCALLRDSRRYRKVQFVDFVTAGTPSSDGQFAALVLRMPDETLLIAFRGTDNTLAGWKEDFDLAFKEEIPAQRNACLCVQKYIPACDAIELCGHSKGGNLALYSAVRCQVLFGEKLRCAVSFDGPGLSHAWRLAALPPIPPSGM